MRLLCKIFRLKIVEESHADNETVRFLKKCVGIIYRFVANVMYKLHILRHVSGGCALAFGNLSDLKKLQTFIIFVTICS